MLFRSLDRAFSSRSLRGVAHQAALNGWLRVPRLLFLYLYSPEIFVRSLLLFTYASRPKCSAGLVVIEEFGLQRGLGVLAAPKYKLNRLQGIYSMRKQLQIYAHCALHTTLCILLLAPRPTMPIRQY